MPGIQVLYYLPLKSLAHFIKGYYYTTGDGLYHLMRDGAWRNVTLQFQDAVIQGYLSLGKNVWMAARALIKAPLIRMNPLDYLTSANAGGQSVSFPSAADVIVFFKAKLDYINDMIGAAGGYNVARAKPYPVDGVYGL